MHFRHRIAYTHTNKQKPTPKSHTSGSKNDKWQLHNYYHEKGLGFSVVVFFCFVLLFGGGKEGRGSIQNRLSPADFYTKFRLYRSATSLRGHLHQQKFPGWTRNSAFTLGRPGTEASRARLVSGGRVSAAHVPLYVICCQEHRAVLWQNSRQMTRQERWWRKTSDSGLVQIANVNAPARAESSAGLAHAVV